jgi:hypothetical protein
MKQEANLPTMIFGDPPARSLVLHFVCGMLLHSEIHKSVLHSRKIEELPQW